MIAPTGAAETCLRQAAAAAGTRVPGLVERLLAYLELLRQWNRTVRLTGERDSARCAAQLLAPSLAGAPHVRGARCADLGSGAGLPGLVLAMALPQTRWTLIDSRRRKACFLLQARTELALDNVEVVCSRIAAYRPERGFDTLTARALGKLPELVALAGPLAAPGARLLAWKGPGVRCELAALERMAVSCRRHRIAPRARRHCLIEVPITRLAGRLPSRPDCPCPGGSPRSA